MKRSILYDRSNNSGDIDVKIDGSVLEEKSSFTMLGPFSSPKLDWGSYTVSIVKTVPKKKFLSPEVALYLYLNTIVMSGQVFQAVSWLR